MTAEPAPDGEPEVRFAGKVFRLTAERVRFPDGRVSHYDVVRHPGAVAILAVLPKPTRVLLVRQYRQAPGRRLWEIPAGTLDRPGESPQDCAARELVEETGYRAGALQLVSTFYTAPGFCDERMHLFAAAKLVRTKGGERDPDEWIDVHEVAWPEALEMARKGEIEDAKTLVALGWFESYLRPRRTP